MTTDTKPLAERLRAWPKQAPTAKELVAAIVEDCIEAADALDAKDALLREAAEALAPFIPLADEIDQLGHEPGSTCLHRLKADDLRRARSLLLKLTEAIKL